MIRFRLTIKKDQTDKCYIITESACGYDDKVWIGNEDGEGGDFDIKKLYEVIDNFFKENF